jgi:putative methyltransferase (TIGR04325 family)
MLPGKVAQLFRHRRRDAPTPRASNTFTGDYACWSDAVQASVGYGAPVILERTSAALLQVKRGDAAFERDSVLFDKPEYAFPMLSGLLRAGVMAGGPIRVVDFGGSLGSSYFQCRRLLGAAATLEWSVVEQRPYVARGRELFEDHELKFYESTDQCLEQRRPDILLLSSVLQYLPDPYGSLEGLLARQLPHVIIDRTAFLVSGRDRLTVQTVPEWIYPASYPAWFLSEPRLITIMAAAGYSLVAGFQGADDVAPTNAPAYSKGFIYELGQR